MLGGCPTLVFYYIIEANHYFWGPHFLGAFQETVAAVKTAADIVDYIESTGVHLKPTGSVLVASCPLPGHDDSTPSFTVYPQTGTYQCFGCGRSGDVITFVQETMGVTDFKETLRLLGGKYGVNVEFPQDKNTDREPGFDYQGVMKVLDDAHKFFRKAYEITGGDKPVKRFVKDRYITDQSVFGYAPAGGDVLYRVLTKRGHTLENLVAAGVCGQTQAGRVYDFWQDRLMFTIMNPAGQPIGFSGRKIREEDAPGGKYVNSKASPVFDKSRALYTPDPVQARVAAQKTKTVFVVEGQFDVLAVRQAGFPAVFASSGTAFTPEQAGLLRRFVGDEGRVVFCFDADKAGVKAAQHVIKHCSVVVPQAWAVELPGGYDPADALGFFGETGLAELLGEQTPLLDFVLSKLVGEYDVTTVAGKNSFIQAAAQLLVAVSSPVVLREAIHKIALLGMVDVDTARTLCENTRVQHATKQPSPPDTTTSTAPHSSNSDDGVVGDVVDADVVLADLIRKDAWYKTAASYIQIMGTWSMGARAAVTGGKHRAVVPNEFHPLLDELATMNTAPLLVPEKFTYQRTATILFGVSDVLGQARFEGEQDFMRRAKYLFHRLEKMRTEHARQEGMVRDYTMLNEDNSLEALERVLNHTD